jgi:hypothetical protein
MKLIFITIYKKTYILSLFFKCRKRETISILSMNIVKMAHYKTCYKNNNLLIK